MQVVTSVDAPLPPGPSATATVATAAFAAPTPILTPSHDLGELHAPAHWQCIDFLSDVHLHRGDSATLLAWAQALQHGPAQALVILGDLFEVWIGDDCANDPSSFEAACIRTLAQASRVRPIYLMCGNRDFLLGPQFMQASGCIALPDPTVLVAQGQRWLLSHGDALCIADTAYQAFRQQVRSAHWQREFLAQPLSARHAQARAMREASQTHQSQQAQAAGAGAHIDGWADVDAASAQAVLAQADCPVLIHGHTHRPADHRLPGGAMRVVLSDWDARAQPPRTQLLRLQDGALHRCP
jgi:UDP-2,3-diacylglucosamine hydrolase